MKFFVPNIDFDLSLSTTSNLRDWSHWQRHFLWAQSFEPSESWDRLKFVSTEEERASDAYAKYLNSLEVALPSSLNKESANEEKMFSTKKTSISFAGRAELSNSLLAKVNSKSFWATNKEQYIFECLDEAIHFLQSLQSHQDASTVHNSPIKMWMLKQAHGNGGWGNLRWSILDSIPEKWLRDCFENTSSIVIEPWRHRLEDWGSSFFITEQGTIQNIHHYQVLNTSRGGFLGIGLWPSLRMEKYLSRLEYSVQQVGKRLFQEGYWGPAQVDHFLWIDEKSEEHIQTPVEVNVRYSMYVIPFGIQQHFSKTSYIFWRLFHSKSFSIPYIKSTESDPDQEIWKKAYQEWRVQTKEYEYSLSCDNQSGQGVLLTTPLGSRKNTSVGVAWLYSNLKEMQTSYQEVAPLSQASLSSVFLKTKSVRDL
jgi:hypothetical protein